MRQVAVPPSTDKQTLGMQLSQLRKIGLHFVEGIGNAEMAALRLPTSLKVRLLNPVENASTKNIDMCRYVV